ncbi:MAG: fatty acid desaturase [Myxococcales bacterium]|nr:fatty acid desaturase [Myxococcales bacterium]
MSTLEHVLAPPRYGFGAIPTNREIVSEFFYRLNVLRCRKNWIPLFAWATTLAFAVPLVVFVTHYFSFWLVLLGFVYSMVLLGSHGTFYLHRYATHRAYRFRSPLWRFVCKNLVIKIVTEETYVISHHVHHRYTEQAGDPYNARAGWLYCFFADVNHQRIAPDLTEAAYARLKLLIDHCGIRLNSFAQYQRWGSLCHPAFAFTSYALNWAFWYAAFYLVGGHALATALFGSAFVWAVGIRTFNFAAHGGGKDRQRPGVDFHTKDHSINQVWPGYVAGEWHNNHHLYPNGARSGFLGYQLDLPWLFIRAVHALGGIQSYRDYKEEFVVRYQRPYLEEQKRLRAEADARQTSQ